LKTILFLLAFIPGSCAPQASKHVINPEAQRLNNKIIPLVRNIRNPDSCRKALSFLDSATAIDSTCFLCYCNKLMFLNALMQYDRAIMTINRLLRMRPNANDLYLAGGVYYIKAGDSVSSTAYFKKALAILNSVLDTMNTANRDYEMLSVNKAIVMIMLGSQVNGDQILQQLYDKEADSADKEYLASYMHKTRAELLDFTGNDYRR
jgi:tetratricopeptide (TPR) repeat protein